MSHIAMKHLDITALDFNDQLNALLAWDDADDLAVHQRVVAIIKDVRAEGDAAVMRYTNQFDQCQFKNMDELILPKKVLKDAWDNLPPAESQALKMASERIFAYAEHQKLESWSFTEANGTKLGQKITPLDKVGLYVPGGKAAYPSSVLMNAIPAKVAGVKELIMVVPTPKNQTNA
ncbi:MAG: histidinol dehydrogenase, partial [Methylococcales bacterium]|nr:histidinol dehydrogenase [Methylococcales bacterium]